MTTLDDRPTTEVDLTARLRQMEYDAVALRQMVEDAEQKHRDDVERIGRWLIEEAQRREWCPDYDRLVEDVNERLNVTLPIRLRHGTVLWTEVLTVRVHRLIEDVDIPGDEDVARVVRSRVQGASPLSASVGRYLREYLGDVTGVEAVYERDEDERFDG